MDRSESSALGPTALGLTRTLSLCFIACVVLVVTLATSAHAGSGSEYTIPERFGAGMAREYGDITDYDVASLPIGWYMDWGYRVAPPRPGGIEYAQLVSTRPGSVPPNWDSLGAAVRANPGSMWFIGNEPDASPNIQDAQAPASYATAYYSIYTFIKDQDPTAQVGPGGVIQPTPLRLRYLDMVLASYAAQYGVPLPADFWGTHVQILQEKRDEWGAGIPAGISDDEGRLYSIQDNGDPAIFEQLVWELRAWMASRGLRDKPLIISEYGVLMPSLYLCYCYDYDVGNAIVVDFMKRSFDFLLSAKDADLGYPADENRLVQRWSWYSLNDKAYDAPPYGEGYNGSLFDWRVSEFPGQLTIFGQAFKSYLQGLSLSYHSAFPTIVWAE